MRLDEITGTLDRPYFSTYSAAVQHARLIASKKGYEVSDDEWFNSVNAGPRKPSKGETVRLDLALTKDDKPVNKMLAIQVYNRGTDTGTYELNFYIT
jgi:hypothetical protein